MRIDAYFTAAEVDPAVVDGSTVVVVDVVRATTTIVEALANGARGIYPTASTEEAVKLAASLGREDTLLCGERRGRKVEGFDLGNSPREFTREAVGGKRLVMSTTNGTRAFGVGQEGVRLLACAFTNLGAVALEVAGDEGLVVLCAGREEHFAIDDALCAGHLIKRVMEAAGGTHGLNDAALAARALAGSRKPTPAFLSQSAGGRALVAIGLGGDLDLCAEVDRHHVVAEMRDQAIILSGK
jgi:2-phosphosulfolactate phosphatase